MKKLLYLLLAITLVACEGDTGPMGPKGEDGQITYWKTESVTILKGEWELDGKSGAPNSFFYKEVTIKNLNEDIYYDGAVIPYILLSDGKSTLPLVRHKESIDQYGNPILWTETIDCEIHPYGVIFRITYSDFSTTIKPEYDEIFEIVLIY